MKPSDPRLQTIAKLSGTRPPHCFYVWHSLKELGGLFDAEVCAAFCQLEVRHVERIVTVLSERGLLPNTATRKAPLRSTSTRLAHDWQMPQEWHDYAAEKRFWKASEILDEAEAFKEHFLKTGQAYANWRMAWQGWVRRSNRPSGQKPFEGTVDQAAFYTRQIAALRSQGRDTEADQLQKTLDGLAGNVLPFRQVG